MHASISNDTVLFDRSMNCSLTKLDSYFKDKRSICQDINPHNHRLGINTLTKDFDFTISQL